MRIASPPASRLGHSDLAELAREIEHVAHLLPSQGPISIFVHHNTLHAFEDEPFETAVRHGLHTYHARPYLSESRYREEFARGRIRREDIEAVLLDDLGDGADAMIGFTGTRFHLRLAMLEHPLLLGADSELSWLIAETDALLHFHPAAPAHLKSTTIQETRDWIARTGPEAAPPQFRSATEELCRSFNCESITAWDDSAWEALTLHLLWDITRGYVERFPAREEPAPEPVRHAEVFLRATGENIDVPVHDLLIRFCAAFLDQGLARWRLPHREEGFFRAFCALYRDSRPVNAWLRRLPGELRRIEAAGISPLELIDESLSVLGVGDEEREEFLQRTLLALPGWTGMLRQMETNAEWTVWPAPPGTLVEYLAVRLLLDRLAFREAAQRELGRYDDLADIRRDLRRSMPTGPSITPQQRAFLVFQLAQVRGWTPLDLLDLGEAGWSRLLGEIDAFPELERRRIYHLAYERRYYTQALDAVLAHQSRVKPPASRVSLQVVTCIDDREESFHRHLEEVDPECETYSVAGFYSVPIYYQGAAEAHFRPLCPVVIKPKHWVREEVAYSLSASSRQRSEARRRLGAASHQWHLQSRSFLGGIVTALLGSLASFPMVMRILFPRTTAHWRRLFGSWIQPPKVTELRLERTADPPGPVGEHLGFTLGEMVDSVEKVLRDLGLTERFARIIIFLGHGSGSLNNPHASAYNCGACSGGRGGPNARAFAWMANNPAVREQLASRGLEIPATTIFVGGFHNTCDEDVTFYDLDRVPASHRRDFERARDVIDAARARDAHERCRRFESAPLNMSFAQALEHAQKRAEDLSEARPEYNHATNALGFVGRRWRTRGLFFDRRVFLNDYDPRQDDADHTILARGLAAAIPVCVGISLEYYFSCVDDIGYGCGSKLPHNIASLLGVMEGALSDLRPGLSRQMIEIHEPMRILFIIETTPEAMDSIMERNPTIARLVRNRWMHLALLDPDAPRILLYREGRYVEYQPESSTLPVVGSSLQWYRGRRDHLGFASIVPDDAASAAEARS